MKTDVLEPQYLKEQNQKYGLFTHHFDAVLAAAEEIKKKPEQVKFLHLLKSILEDHLHSAERLRELEMPAPDTVPKEFSMIPVFAYIALAGDMHEKLVRRNVPEDIITETMRACEETMDAFQDHFGYPGLHKGYVQWLRPYIEGRRLDIGRFNFDALPAFQDDVTVIQHVSGERRILLNRDEILPNSEWQTILQKGDSVIGVHIPGKKSFTTEVRLASYERAWKVFRECYREYEFKAFTCSSWMMDPQLKELLKPESNLIGFQSEFMLYPQEGDGEAMHFIFGREAGSLEEIKMLPEDTGLRRIVKNHYLQGKSICRGGGIRFQE